MSPILKPRFTTIQHSQLKVCPAGWFTTATSRLCLKLIHTPENWTDARIKCQAENADLVIKIDQEKQNFMFANSSRLLVWIGLNDRRQEGTFNWLDDTQKCSEFGHTELLLELRHNESQDLQNFLRMDFKFFIELLRMLDPMMVNPTTSMWGPISLTERLSITLRYLASENTFEDIKITSAVAPQT
ncbi:hypothetical protein RRG08_049947 [Elysia crispata]|uniref:C-type lectin domain-containing protein n=1 Tax=Elysia crispata TaxID=231223 RepID=A0AAE0Y5J5_9GAST|nr:hypothetical protein RRG08_049947 [Elysia crispata]